MTYCLGILVNDGLVLAADSRTNAGVDNIARFRKLFVFENPGERMIAVMTAGNLAVTQAVITQLEEGLDGEDPANTLLTVESMSAAAQMVGRAVRNVRDRDAAYLNGAGEAGFSATFILGGQIQGRRMRLLQIYSAGNYIEASDDTPYLQIGESKYGKPILERVVTPELDLLQAAKCALVSLDSTIRSNIAVGPPIDLLVYRRDACHTTICHRLGADDPYYQLISREWGQGLTSLFDELPTPEWGTKLED